jgi:hypothetical protein
MDWGFEGTRGQFLSDAGKKTILRDPDPFFRQDLPRGMPCIRFSPSRRLGDRNRQQADRSDKELRVFDCETDSNAFVPLCLPKIRSRFGHPESKG